MVAKKTNKKNKKEVKKNSKIKELYQQSFDFIKEAKWFIVLSFGFFCLFFILGFSFDFFHDKLLEIAKNLMLEFDGLNMFQTICKIFFNNTKTVFVGMLMCLAFGYMGIYSSLYNGYIGGFIGRQAVNVEGLAVLWKLFPHGIFELTAIFIGLGIGIFLAYKFIELVFKQKRWKNILILKVASLIMIPILIAVTFGVQNFDVIYSLIIVTMLLFVLFKTINNKELKTYIVKAIKTFFLIILPLLLIAAIIEGIFMFVLP